MKKIFMILLLPVLLFSQTTFQKSRYKQAWYDATKEHSSTIATIDSSAIVFDRTTSGKWWIKLYDTAGNLIFKVDTLGVITADSLITDTDAYAGGVPGSGDITSVTAGNGLSGGGVTGAVTLKVDTTLISTLYKVASSINDSLARYTTNDLIDTTKLSSAQWQTFIQNHEVDAAAQDSTWLSIEIGGGNTQTNDTSLVTGYDNIVGPYSLVYGVRNKVIHGGIVHGENNQVYAHNIIGFVNWYNNSLVLGSNDTSATTGNMIIGSNNYARTDAMGDTANSGGSTIIGSQNQNFGTCSLVVGELNRNSAGAIDDPTITDQDGTSTLVVGAYNYNRAPYSLVGGIKDSVGLDGESTAYAVVVGGMENHVLGSGSITVGSDLDVNNSYSANFGQSNETYGSHQLNFGYGNYNKGGLLVGGSGNRVDSAGIGNVVIGDNNHIKNPYRYSYIFGTDDTTDAWYAWAIGRYLKNAGTRSILMGHGLTDGTPMTQPSDYTFSVGFKSTIPTLVITEAGNTAGSWGSVGIGDNTPDARFEVDNGGILASDSLTIGAGGVWVRNMFRSGNDIGIISYNSSLSRIDTVFAYKTEIGDISSVTASDLLTGGGTSGSVILKVDTTKAATQYDISLKQNVSDTTSKDATRYWVGQQNYLVTEIGDISNVNVNAPLTGGGSSGSVTISADTSSGNNKLATQYYVLSHRPDSTWEKITVNDSMIIKANSKFGYGAQNPFYSYIDSTGRIGIGREPYAYLDATNTNNLTKWFLMFARDKYRPDATDSLVTTVTGTGKWTINPGMTSTAADTGSALNIGGGVKADTFRTPHYKLPHVDGSINQVLATNGSGVVSWSTITETGDIAGVTAGDWLSGGGTSGTVTLAVDTAKAASVYDLTLKQNVSDTLSKDATRFWVQSQGYATGGGDIESVTAGDWLSGGGITGAVTLNVDTTKAASLYDLSVSINDSLGRYTTNDLLDTTKIDTAQYGKFVRDHESSHSTGLSASAITDSLDVYRTSYKLDTTKIDTSQWGKLIRDHESNHLAWVLAGAVTDSLNKYRTNFKLDTTAIDTAQYGKFVRDHQSEVNAGAGAMLASAFPDSMSGYITDWRGDIHDSLGTLGSIAYQDSDAVNITGGVVDADTLVIPTSGSEMRTGSIYFAPDVENFMIWNSDHWIEYYPQGAIKGWISDSLALYTTSYKLDTTKIDTSQWGKFVRDHEASSSGTGVLAAALTDSLDAYRTNYKLDTTKIDTSQWGKFVRDHESSPVDSARIITNANDPTTDGAGEIAIDNNSSMVEFYDGTASRHLGALQCRTWTILQPDSLRKYSDDVCLMHVMADAFPFGITIKDIAISSSANCSDTHVVEEWSNRAGSTQSTIESIALSAENYKEDDGTLSDAAIAADTFININLDDSTDHLASLEVTITFYVNGGN